MNYLFFDIECANCDGGNGKICSFGYVLTDVDFNVLEYKDLLIDPKSKFKLNGYGKKTYIELAYPEEVFRSSPPFPFYTEKIRSLLCDENNLIFGYAPENDASFLRSEYERYRIKEADFVFHDVQRLFKLIVGGDDAQLCSLTTACETLNIDTEFMAHKSCDDAYATMLVLKSLCRISDKSPALLVADFPKIKGELKNGEITANYFRKRTELKPGEENFMKGKNKDDFRYLVRRLSQTKGKGKVCFSWPYEYYNFREMIYLVSELSKIGYKYTSKLSEADIFVKKPKYVRRICKREKEIEEAIKCENPNNVSNIKRKLRVIEFETLLALLGINERTVRRESSYSVGYIKDLKNGKISE